jgi:hypothetical protein
MGHFWLILASFQQSIILFMDLHKFLLLCGTNFLNIYGNVLHEIC